MFSIRGSFRTVAITQLGYPDGPDFKTFYPTNVMETAGEIIFFWVTRMIMLGLYAAAMFLSECLSSRIST